MKLPIGSVIETLSQINQRGYAQQLQQEGISHILKLSMAFSGKQVAVVSELFDAHSATV